MRIPADNLNMKRLTYSKQFLTGNLAGLSVRCSFDVPAEDAHARSLELARMARCNPGRDAVTGDQFFVYNVGCLWPGEVGFENGARA